MLRAMTLVLVAGVACGCKTGVAGPSDLASGDMAAAPVQKVDVLFMIDNSLGIGPKPLELRQRFPQFVQALDDAARKGHPASYHFGVVSSDLGAASNTRACKAGGDGGLLHIGPDPAVQSVPPACANLTLGGGVRFLDYNQLDGTNNIGGGADVPTAFNCMAAVGDMGCGFEHQLESVYRALHGDIAENHDFLRADALLVVVYLTDEDDCSAPDDTDLFEAATDTYGTLHSFRCTQYGIACGDPAQPLSVADAGGPLSGCRPLRMAEGGKLFDVDRYIDFFTKPAAMGGVKDNPANVIVAAIASPLDPFIVKNTMPCQDQVNTASCLILGNSCAAEAQYAANPSVRMAAVVNAVANSQLTSVCDTDFTPPLEAVAQRIVARLQ